MRCGAITAPIGGYFQNLAYNPLNSDPNTPPTFYDAIANIGIVTLEIWQPASTDISGNRGNSYLTVPRFAISDVTKATFAVYNNGATVPPDNRQYLWVQVRDGTGNKPNRVLTSSLDGSLQFFTSSGPYVPPGGDLTQVLPKNGLLRGYHWEKIPGPAGSAYDSSGVYVQFDPATGIILTTTNNQSHTAAPAYFSGAQAGCTGNPISCSASLLQPNYRWKRVNPEFVASYRGSSVLEFGLRDFPTITAAQLVIPAGTTSTITAPPLSNGTVFRLGGDVSPAARSFQSLAVFNDYRNTKLPKDSSLPGIDLNSNDSVNSLIITNAANFNGQGMPAKAVQR